MRKASNPFLVSNSPEREPSWSHGPAVYGENVKKSLSTPQFITALPFSQSPSEELLKHLPSPATRELSTSQTSVNLNFPSTVSSDRPYQIIGLEADPSDSRDTRNLGHDADKCYQKLYAAINSAQSHCLGDHLWHLLLKGVNSEESGNESQLWKPKGRRKTEYRRGVNDLTENWTVPSSIRDIADNSNVVREICYPTFLCPRFSQRKTKSILTF